MSLLSPIAFVASSPDPSAPHPGTSGPTRPVLSCLVILLLAFGCGKRERTYASDEAGGAGGESASSGGTTANSSSHRGGSTATTDDSEGGSTENTDDSEGGSTATDTSEGGSAGDSAESQGGSAGDSAESQGGSAGDSAESQGGSAGDSAESQGGSAGSSTESQGGSAGSAESSSAGGTVSAGGAGTGGASVDEGGSPSVGGGSATGGSAAATTCVINSTVYESGEFNGDNQCQYCEPSKSTTAWASLVDGASCGDGMVCSGKSCKSGCFIDGAYVTADKVNTSNPCLSCDTSLSTSSWSSTPTSTCVQAISAGSQHTCASFNGSAYCWGRNTFTPKTTALYGLLGSNDTSAAKSLTPVAVTGLGTGVTALSAGAYHSCAVANGGAYCWGYNSPGQLGNGDSTVTFSATPLPVEGLVSGVTAIDTGSYFSCALQGDAVSCWGKNSYGQLAVEASTYSSSYSPLGWAELGDNVTSVGTGSEFACSVINGGAYCWGYNSGNALGYNYGVSSPSIASSSTPLAVGNLTSGVTSISAGSNHACALVNGAVYCWGTNSLGQLGDGSTTTSIGPVAVSGLPSGVSAISVGGGVSCAIANGAAYCWGSNGAGGLGNNSTTDSSVPVLVEGLTANVTAISAGGGHNCAIVSGNAYCWGNNTYGQLGDRSTNTESLIPVQVQAP